MLPAPQTCGDFLVKDNQETCGRDTTPENLQDGCNRYFFSNTSFFHVYSNASMRSLIPDECFQERKVSCIATETSGPPRMTGSLLLLTNSMLQKQFFLYFIQPTHSRCLLCKVLGFQGIRHFPPFTLEEALLGKAYRPLLVVLSTE